MCAQVWQGLWEHVAAQPDEWQRVYDAQAPERAPLPAPWQQLLDGFQRLLVLRALRPDKLVPALTAYVADVLGARLALEST